MLVILIGKSATGKDTLLQEVLQDDFQPLISITSRPIRDGETNGKEYHFISRSEFEEKLKKNEFLEYRTYDTLVNNIPETWYYGLPKYNLEKDENYITILDVQGAKDTIAHYGKENIFCVYIDVPNQIREERAKQRGSFDQIEWDRRLIDDEKKFSKENLDPIIDLYLSNTKDINTLKASFYEVYQDVLKKHDIDYPPLSEIQKQILNDKIYSSNSIELGDGAYSHHNIQTIFRYNFLKRYNLSENIDIIDYYENNLPIYNSENNLIFFCKDMNTLRDFFINEQNNIDQDAYETFKFELLDAYPNCSISEVENIIDQIISYKENELENIELS